MITVTPPTHTLLLDIPQLRRELGLSESADPILSEQARHVSGAIVSYCGQDFARVSVVETVTAVGTRLLVTRTPIVQVISVLQDNTPILDATVENAGAGLLTRATGWTWASEAAWWPNSSGVGFGWGAIDTLLAPASILPPISVTYVAGYLLPEDDVVTPSVAVDGVAKTLTLSTGTWPLLVPGDRIQTSGFFTAANNGFWTVLTRTATVVTVVEAGLVTEAEGATGSNPKTLRVRTLPDDVARAALDTLKSWYIGRERDPVITSRAIAGLSLTYATGGTLGLLSLPPAASALLAPFRRASS